MKTEKIEIELKRYNIFIMKTGWHASVSLKEEKQIENFLKITFFETIHPFCMKFFYFSFNYSQSFL